MPRLAFGWGTNPGQWAKGADPIKRMLYGESRAKKIDWVFPILIIGAAAIVAAVAVISARKKDDATDK